MDALEEAANRVALAKKNDGRLAVVSKAGRDDGFHLGSRSNTFGDHKWGFETLSAVSSFFLLLQFSQFVLSFIFLKDNL